MRYSRFLIICSIVMFWWLGGSWGQQIRPWECFVPANCAEDEICVRSETAGYNTCQPANPTNNTNPGGGVTPSVSILTTTPTFNAENWYCEVPVMITFPRMPIRVWDLWGVNPPLEFVSSDPDLTSLAMSYSIIYSIGPWRGQDVVVPVDSDTVCFQEDANGCSLYNTYEEDTAKIDCIDPNNPNAAANQNAAPIAMPPNMCTSPCKSREVCINNSCVCNPTNKEGKCCGVDLLTNVPFIGKCIHLVSESDKKAMLAAGLYNIDPNALVITDSEAFPRLMLGLIKILVTVILLWSFIAIIVAGVMMAASGSSDTNASKGRQLIGSIIAALALLGASGVILRLINPTFFK